MRRHRGEQGRLAAPGHNIFECPDLCEDGDRFEFRYDSDQDVMVMDELGPCDCECHGKTHL